MRLELDVVKVGAYHRINGARRGSIRGYLARHKAISWTDDVDCYHLVASKLRGDGLHGREHIYTPVGYMLGLAPLTQIRPPPWPYSSPSHCAFARRGGIHARLRPSSALDYSRPMENDSIDSFACPSSPHRVSQVTS